MKAYIAKRPDLEYEVDDVVLVIEEDGQKIICRIKGFNDYEWEEASAFAEKLAQTLGIEFIGEIEEYIHVFEEDEK
jgi:hypothetical protein